MGREWGFNVDMMGDINNIKQPCGIWIHLGLLKTGITLNFGYPVVRHKQHLSFEAVKPQTSANIAPCSSSECNRRTFSLGPTTSFQLHPQVHQYDIRTGHEIGSQLRELSQIKPSVLPSAYIYMLKLSIQFVFLLFYIYDNDYLCFFSLLPSNIFQACPSVLLPFPEVWAPPLLGCGRFPPVFAAHWTGKPWERCYERCSHLPVIFGLHGTPKCED